MKITNALTILHKFFPKESETLSKMINESEKDFFTTQLFSELVTYKLIVRKKTDELEIYATENGFEQNKITNENITKNLLTFLEKHERSL